MKLTPKVARWALPLLQPRRYKGVKGGRSGGKSHQIMEMNVARWAAEPNLKIACIREVQKSIRFSVKSLMEQKIETLGVGHLFDVQESVIKHKMGAGVAIFEGMQDHTADSIKGLEDFDIALVDEANALSHRSLTLLRPTIRKAGSELHFAWNPNNADDPVDSLFRENEGSPRFICIHVNITDNPFVSDTAWEEYESDKALAQSLMAKDANAWDSFLHVWHGAYNVRSEKFVFRNWRINEMQPPERAVWHYGVDFGFAQDPTAALRCCLLDRRTLYVDAEAYEVGVPNEALPALIGKIPDARNWFVTADSARPETIDYLRRNGFPKIRGAKKGKGSVEDGISFLQGLEIIVHPRCVNLQRELGAYAYEIDKRTNDIIPRPEDANNHLIDALRYACERLHIKSRLIPVEAQDDNALMPPPDYGGRRRAGGDSWKVV